MSILAWMVLGLIAGFVASKIVNKTGEGVVMDIVLGVVGAVAGGWLFNGASSSLLSARRSSSFSHARTGRGPDKRSDAHRSSAAA
jgi:uncharacterized membrane protein YeaQ/YmgE (transglycosylase-associated protein family)